MQRRKIKFVADGILNSFISRNNDVDGYWGIGQLYTLMLQSNNMQIVINVKEKTIIPYDAVFNNMILFYHEKFFSTLKRCEISENRITSAKIILNGHLNEKQISLGLTAPHRMECEFQITDELGIMRRVSKNVWCRAHDPKKEIRRRS